MAAIIELTNDEWDLVKDLFDPAGRPGVPARYPRRLMFEAMLFLARTGLPVALPAGPLPGLGGRLTAVATLASEWRLGQAVDPVDGAADPHDRAPVARVEPELEPELLVQRRANGRELALPEVVEQGGGAAAVGLLGRGVGKPGRLPLGREELPEVMAASAVRVGLDGAREPVKQIVNIADEHGEL